MALIGLVAPAGCADDPGSSGDDTATDDVSSMGDDTGTQSSDGPGTTTDDGVDETAAPEDCETPPVLAEGNALGMISGIEHPYGITVGPTSVIVYDGEEALLFSKAGGCPISIPNVWADRFAQDTWGGYLGGRFVLAGNPSGFEGGIVVAIDDATGETEALLEDEVIFSFASAGDRAYFQNGDANVVSMSADGTTELLVEDGVQSVDDLGVYERVRVVGNRVAMAHEDRTRISSWAGTPGVAPQTVFDAQGELDTFLTTIDASLLQEDSIAFVTSVGNLTLASRGSVLYGTKEVFDEPPIELGTVQGDVTLARIHGDAVDLVIRPDVDSPRQLVRQSVGGTTNILTELPVDSALGVVFDGDEAWFVSGDALVVVEVAP